MKTLEPTILHKIYMNINVRFPLVPFPLKITFFPSSIYHSLVLANKKKSLAVLA